MFQEVGLQIQASGVARQLPAAPDHPVAGDQEGDGVPMDRIPHSSGGPRLAELKSQLPIRTGFTKGNFQEEFPDPGLEGGALGIQPAGEFLQLGAKITAELDHHLPIWRRIFSPGPSGQDPFQIVRAAEEMHQLQAP